MFAIKTETTLEDFTRREATEVRICSHPIISFLAVAGGISRDWMLVLGTRIMELVEEEKVGEKGMSNPVEIGTRIEVRLQKDVSTDLKKKLEN